MKQSELQEIQDTVRQYAQIISQVIKVDVEIVDNCLVRIAGTGIYQDRINEDMSAEGLVYKQVLATGEPQVIQTPGEHPLCVLCPKHGCCSEEMEMCTPIKLGSEIIGVIGLICSTPEQKQNLLGDFETYRQFLLQIAEFISAKVYVQRENERYQAMMQLLSQVVDGVDKGVLVLDSHGRIAHSNSTAVKQLLLRPDTMQQAIGIEATGDSLLGVEEYKVTVGDRTFKLMGEMLLLEPALAPFERIFIFNEMKKFKSGIYGLTNVGPHVSLQNIVGSSEAICQVKDKILKIADSNSTVLITGESGTGKELIARAIHAESSRHDKPFIAINCGAIPDTLLESELFGYVKGAFTGADPRGKIGKFELANKGIIFLDEVGDMPLYLQIKLLRVLQERKLVRIGSNQVIELDVRVIAATNRNLKALIRENKFREDLYYRLNVIPIEAPPLRNRLEDIPAIVNSMIEKYSGLFNKAIKKITPEALAILMQYSWPGNVREMENTIEFMINMADESGLLTKDTLPKNVMELAEPVAVDASPSIRPLREIEREHILRAVKVYGPTTQGKQLAAKQLGIGIATLYRKLEDIT
ncbi:sigma 54-interacting transcriptional regulator [Sporomusa sp. GT1]|uniref:sigma 54-interacting transcriptional regulator n=1 Tax=Sporomusa sp. GT1 TaxID=1534747 RepID=UPI001663CA69|nr:sigma 54-interacting transcriptional regulator [Sporomusa sp. GT1]